MRPRLVELLWHLLKFVQPFHPEVFAKKEAKMRCKKLERLEAMATTLNYRIIPIQCLAQLVSQEASLLGLWSQNNVGDIAFQTPCESGLLNRGHIFHWIVAIPLTTRRR